MVKPGSECGSGQEYDGPEGGQDVGFDRDQHGGGPDRCLCVSLFLNFLVRGVFFGGLFLSETNETTNVWVSPFRDKLHGEFPQGS